MLCAAIAVPARSCARVDSRLPTAKTCSNGRVDVNRHLFRAVAWERKTFSHGLGPKRSSTLKICCDAKHGSQLPAWQGGCTITVINIAGLKPRLA
jgi:hypothetical protein